MNPSKNQSCEAAIALRGVSVRYGQKAAVSDVSFTVPQGSVYALLGRNGAGKSSLVRCILGQQRPEEGSVSIFGSDAWRERAVLMERVGVVAEDGDAPPEMRVGAIAEFYRSIYSRWLAPGVDARLKRFAIDVKSRFGELSKGQKKQVLLTMALASSPELLILDDPTLGLDVVARKSLFEEVIAELADRGITVLITTHDLAGVESIADRVGVLDGGRLIIDEELESLKARFRRIRTSARPVAMTAANLSSSGVRTWGSGTEAVITNYDEVSFERFRGTTEVIETSTMSLEEIFITVTGDEGEVQ